MKIDLIITCYKPDKTIFEVVETMSRQSVPVNKIIVLNVEQKYFDRVVYSGKFMDNHKNVEVHHVSRREFDNGRLRNAAVKYSDAEYFLMMTQDSIPVGTELVSDLLKPFLNDESVAVSYARQVHRANMPEAEKYAKKYYYPEDSFTTSLADFENMGVRAFHSSNACAMYKRNIFDSLGGFTNHAITNEDVLFAANACHEGYKIVYSSEAVIIYSTVMENKDYMKKYFDLAVSCLKHPEVFDYSVQKNENRKLFKIVLNHLKRDGFKHELLSFYIREYYKRKGFSKGKKYKKMTHKEIEHYTYNKSYWDIDEMMRDRAGVNSKEGYGRSEKEREMLTTPPVKAKNKTEN